MNQKNESKGILALKEELTILRKRLEGIERDDEYCAIMDRAIEVSREIRNLERLLK